MTEINLNEFTEFSQVKDIWNDCLHDKYGLHEFLKNVVMNMNPDCNNGFGNMLPNLSNIYVLVSKKNFPFDKLTSNQKHTIDFSVAKQNFVIGYIWICPWILKNEGCVPYHFIHFIDSRISGLNITKYMIEKYEEDEERYLFPFEVLYSAKNYWKKYFMEVYNITNKNELTQMVNDFNFKSEKEIKWSELFMAFEI